MAKSAARSRIDALLVERGLVQSRQQAQAILLAGDIRVDGATITRPGALVAPGALIEVLQRPRFVSRGGDKLAHALETFHIDPAGLTCADLGASTGGFTDCLLQNGARRVYAVDVGYGILDYGLRNDERVVVMERTNARDLQPLPDACDLAVFDLSFIGVEKVIPAACRSLKPGGRASRSAQAAVPGPPRRGRQERRGQGPPGTRRGHRPLREMERGARAAAAGADALAGHRTCRQPRVPRFTCGWNNAGA